MKEYIVEAKISAVIVSDNEKAAVDKMRDKLVNDYDKWDFSYTAINIPPPSINEQ